MNTLQRQQQEAQCYGLRGDISSTQASMNNNLSQAPSALQRQDTKRAKNYVTMAERDVEALEKFVGR